MHTLNASSVNQAENRRWPAQAVFGPRAGGIGMPPVHSNASNSHGWGQYGEEPVVELLEFLDIEDVERHIVGHDQGLCAIHGYHPAPDWDDLLDCGRPPEDPSERYRWEITREAFNSIKPFLREREEVLTRYRKGQAYKTALAALRRRDPLSLRVHVAPGPRPPGIDSLRGGIRRTGQPRQVGRS